MRQSKEHVPNKKQTNEVKKSTYKNKRGTLEQTKESAYKTKISNIYCTFLCAVIWSPVVNFRLFDVCCPLPFFPLSVSRSTLGSSYFFLFLFCLAHFFVVNFPLILTDNFLLKSKLSRFPSHSIRRFRPLRVVHVCEFLYHDYNGWRCILWISHVVQWHRGYSCLHSCVIIGIECVATRRLNALKLELQLERTEEFHSGFHQKPREEWPCAFLNNNTKTNVHPISLAYATDNAFVAFKQQTWWFVSQHVVLVLFHFSSLFNSTLFPSAHIFVPPVRTTYSFVLFCISLTRSFYFAWKKSQRARAVMQRTPNDAMTTQLICTER